MRSHTYLTFFTVLSSVLSKSLFLLGKNRKKKFFLFQTVRGRSYPQLVHRLIHKQVMHRLIHRQLIHSVIHTVVHSRGHSSTQCIHSVHRLYILYTQAPQEAVLHRLHTAKNGSNTVQHGGDVIILRCSTRFTVFLYSRKSSSQEAKKYNR